MIPPFDSGGLLPEGIHDALWGEFEERFGFNEHRRNLIAGLNRAVSALGKAGCKNIFVDGSFVTAKVIPNDFDCCWDIDGVDPDLMDSVFFDFSNLRAAQKAKYGGEFFPAQTPEASSGRTFLEFFQIDKETGAQKGIIRIDLSNVKNDQK